MYKNKLYPDFYSLKHEHTDFLIIFAIRRPLLDNNTLIEPGEGELNSYRI